MARLVSTALFLVGLLLGTGYAGQALEVYRAKHRLAQELVTIAESALGNEGQVTLDSRTATLVLSGTPGAVRRARTLLEQVDRPLR